VTFAKILLLVYMMTHGKESPTMRWKPHPH